MRDVYKFETLPLIKQELYRAETKPCGLTEVRGFKENRGTLGHLISP